MAKPHGAQKEAADLQGEEGLAGQDSQGDGGGGIGGGGGGDDGGGDDGDGGGGHVGGNGGAKHLLSLSLSLSLSTSLCVCVFVCLFVCLFAWLFVLYVRSARRDAPFTHFAVCQQTISFNKQLAPSPSPVVLAKKFREQPSRRRSS